VRVGLDARFLTHPQRGGFKAHVQGLIEGLARLEPRLELVLYVDRDATSAQVPSGSSFEIRVVRSGLPLMGMPWREQVWLPMAIRKDHLDVFHAPCHTAPAWLRVPLVVTIHDMLWRVPRGSRAATVQRAALDLYYREMTMRTVRRAQAIVTVSEASRSAIGRELPFVDAASIIVAHNAPRACFRPRPPTDTLRGSSTDERVPAHFILGLASADPRKNVTTLIRAFAQLAAPLREHYALVVVWAHPGLASSARELCEALGIGPQVHFLHAVSDDDLAVLYSMATLFVFPSLAEGFGMPALEAMACGTAVIASDDPAIVETTGDAALLVDARRVDEVASAMTRGLMDEGLRQTLCARGAARARQFTWDACAATVAGAYKMAVEARARDKRSATAR
jgi:glycosyltransferase involved in cell wall biosynthesis